MPFVTTYNIQLIIIILGQRAMKLARMALGKLPTNTTFKDRAKVQSVREKMQFR